MAPVSSRLSLAATLAISVNFILTMLASIRARGLYQTLLFAALGLGFPLVAEYHTINTARLLRHHLRPQFKGIPLAIALAWYIAVYNTFTVLESLVIQWGVPGQRQRTFLPLATALTATSMDLVADVALLDQGFWEWTVDGAYAPEVSGPNGKHGVPLANYLGWLGLTGLVTTFFLLLRGREPAMPGLPSDTAKISRAGWWAVLLLLPGYLGAVLWEVRQRRWIYILYSLLFPLVLLKTWLGNRG
jgi:uncharacterized membrane protein